jgi:hypothetical protein
MPHLAGVKSPFPVLTGRNMAGAGGVLVGPDHAAVHVMDQPIQLPAGIGAPLDLGQ